MRRHILQLGLAGLMVIGASGASQAEPCRDESFENARYIVCSFDPAKDDMRLYWRGHDGRALRSFGALSQALQEQGQSLQFAMNGGMYERDFSPVGLYIENGQQITRIVTRSGPGNFGLLPNGVLCLSDDTARIIESREFASNAPKCRDATQSGPMLVIDGELHPRFLPKSSTRFIRNGVGVTEAGRLITAISDQPVNFHVFGPLFRDQLKTPHALFLDGNISRLVAPDLNRHDIGFPLGPMLVVTRPVD